MSHNLLKRVADKHVYRDFIFINDNVFDQGFKQALLGFSRGLVQILHGKADIVVQKLAGMGVHLGDTLLGLQLFAQLAFNAGNLGLKGGHFLFKGGGYDFNISLVEAVV